MDEIAPGIAAALNDLDFFYKAAGTTTGDTNGGGLKEFSLRLPEPLKFLNIYIQNHRYNDDGSKSWNDASILVGRDKTYLSSSLTKCYDWINDGGMLKLALDCQKLLIDVIAFRRQSMLTGLWGGGDFRLYMSEMRAY